MCCQSKSRAIYDNPKNSSRSTIFHPYCLRFSCDAIMQPASTGCSSRVWVFPISILQRKNGLCIYEDTACGRYEASQCVPRFENHFAIETVRFQVQLEADGYFSVQEIFAFAIVASRASWYNLQFFESDFSNPTSKILVGLRPNPIFSTKLRRLRILADDEQANFLRKNLSNFMVCSIQSRSPNRTY